MSDADTSGLDLREQIARIDRLIIEGQKLQAESTKLQAENTKLQAESTKLQAEGNKFMAETRKLGRDRFLAPLVALIGLIAALSTLLGGIAGRVLSAYGYL